MARYFVTVVLSNLIIALRIYTHYSRVLRYCQVLPLHLVTTFNKPGVTERVQHDHLYPKVQSIYLIRIQQLKPVAPNCVRPLSFRSRSCALSSYISFLRCNKEEVVSLYPTCCSSTYQFVYSSNCCLWSFLYDDSRASPPDIAELTLADSRTQMSDTECDVFGIE